MTTEVTNDGNSSVTTSNSTDNTQAAGVTPAVTDTTSDTTSKTLKVDVFGEEIELPIEKAKALISKRDERTSIFKDLKTKVDNYEKELTETKRRAEGLEKAKNGALAEAEAIFSQKVQAKLDRLHTKLVDQEIESTLKSIPEFIGTEDVTKDVMKLLKVDNKFVVDEETGEIKTDTGKPAKELVQEFVNARDTLKKPTNTAFNGGRRIAGATPAQTPKERPSMADGLKKKFGL